MRGYIQAFFADSSQAIRGGWLLGLSRGSTGPASVLHLIDNRAPGNEPVLDRSSGTAGNETSLMTRP